MKYLMIFSVSLFINGCNQQGKSVYTKLFNSVDNLNQRGNEIDTCWLRTDESKYYDTCFLIKNDKNSYRLLLFASKQYNTVSDYLGKPNTQIIFAKEKRAKDWDVFTIDTIYTQGDIDLWTDSSADNTSPKFFIKATVGNNGNLCAHLYEYCDSQKTFKKIKGFEFLPNATFSDNGTLISSLSISGQYSLSFYKLKIDTINKINNIEAKILDSTFYNKMNESVGYLNNKVK